MTALIARLLGGLSPQARFFRSSHLLQQSAAEARGWSMHLDEAVGIVDTDHLRLGWALHDRYYG